MPSISNAVLAAAPDPIADGTPQLGTSKRWTQWTNGTSAMLAHLPREVSLGRSFADFQLHSGRTLELQRTSDISIGTIEQRRRDHAAHSAGDPVWWLDAAGMFKGDYFMPLPEQPATLFLYSPRAVVRRSIA